MRPLLTRPRTAPHFRVGGPYTWAPKTAEWLHPPTIILWPPNFPDTFWKPPPGPLGSGRPTRVIFETAPGKRSLFLCAWKRTFPHRLVTFSVTTTRRNEPPLPVGAPQQTTPHVCLHSFNSGTTRQTYRSCGLDRTQQPFWHHARPSWAPPTIWFPDHLSPWPPCYDPPSGSTTRL